MRFHSHCALLALATTAALGLSGCKKETTSAYQGYVEGKFVYISSPQAGRLDRLSVSRGDTIALHAPLFALDAEPESSAERQARELLAADQSRLADMQTGKRPPEKEVISAQLAEAKIQYQKSLDLLKISQKQYAAGGVPRTDLINAQAAVELNAAQIREAEKNLEVAGLEGREAQMKAQAHVIAADRAALAQAQWKLQQKQVASTRGGLVFDTLYREGEWIPSGTPVVQLLPPENIEVRFFVPQSIVGGLKLGQNINVHCDGCAANVPAKITFLSAEVEYTPPVIYSNESRDKLVLMVIAKPSPDNAPLLHPGQPIEVALQ
jgi:HlyD family secretion protein